MTTSLRLTLTLTLIIALLFGLSATASAASKKPSRATSKAVMKTFAGGRVSIREAVSPQADGRLFIAEYDRGVNQPQTFPATPVTGIAGFFAGNYAILSFYANGQHLFSRGGEVPVNVAPYPADSAKWADSWSWVDPSGNPLNESQRAAVVSQYNRAIARLRPVRLGGGYRATAYGPPWSGLEGGAAPGACSTSATGVQLCQGKQLLVVAANPKSFPYGTQLKIVPNPFNNPNLVFTVADTGAALAGNQFDFFVASGRAEQNAFARKRVRIWYLGRIPFDLGVPITEADLLPGPANELR